MYTIFRIGWRVAHFVTALAIIFLDYLVIFPRTPLARAQWMQRGSQRVLSVMRVEYVVRGNFPADGVIVSNHLSYVDVLVLSAIAPCVFVAKSEVRKWPVFGWLATLAGTVYVERDRAHTAVIANRNIEDKFSGGLPLVFFPEGTTTDGSEILSFKSAIFNPASVASQPIHCAHIRYELLPGNEATATVAQNVCYWGEMSIVPHLVGLLSLHGVRAEVRFADSAIYERDRKLAAQRAEATVRALAQPLSAEPSTPEAATA